MKNPLLIQPKAFLKRVYPKAVWNLQRSEKVIYLTFDDGPIPGLTEWVLEELDRFQAKATFFCVGANIEKHPGVFDALLSKGHRVANHTMHHIRGFKTLLPDYIKEVEACERLTGTRLFRPPYGQLKRSQYRALVEQKYRIVMWDVISYDYEKISPEHCLANVLGHTQNGSVVLFHDNLKAEANLRYALPRVLKHFSDLDYTFKTIQP